MDYGDSSVPNRVVAGIKTSVIHAIYWVMVVVMVVRSDFLNSGNWLLLKLFINYARSVNSGSFTEGMAKGFLSD